MELRLSNPGLASPFPQKEVLADFRTKMEKESFDEVVLDLVGMEKMFSWAIKVVVGIHKECEKKGKPFCVETNCRSILSLFKMLKLDSLFSVKAVNV